MHLEAFYDQAVGDTLHFLAPPRLRQTPEVVARFQKDGFTLGRLKDQTVAMWPLAKVNLDDETVATINQVYGDRDKFMDALSLNISTKLIGSMHPGFLSSEKVMAELGGSSAQRAVLNPDNILGNQDLNNRFAPPSTDTDLNSLALLPFLKGIHFITIPRDLSIGRQYSSFAGSDPTTVPDGVGGVVVSPGTPGGTSVVSNARLRLAIIDLDTRVLVWDGAILAQAWPTGREARALHSIEDDLAGHFLEQVDPARIANEDLQMKLHREEMAHQ